MREGYKKTEVGVIPEDWEVKKLGLVTQLIKDGTHNPPTRVDKGIPLLSAENIFNRKVNYGINEKNISIDDYNIMHKNYTIDKGDILMTIVGTIGRVAVVKDNNKFTVQRSVAIIKSNEEVNNDYLAYFLESEICKKDLNRRSNSTAQAGLYLGELGKIKIIVPPLKEQEKIAEILSTVDSQIDDTEKLIEKCKELKKGLMQKLLTRGIGHSEFKKTEVGEIPASWEVNKLSNITDVRDGTHDSPQYVETGIPFVTSKNLKEFGIDFSDVNYISNEDHEKFSKRSLVDNGDILFGMIGTIGNPVLVKKTFDFSIKNVALIKIDNNLINNTYLLNILKSSIIEKQFSKLSNGGVQKFISLGMIRNLLIPIPSKKEQEKIAEILSLLDNDIQEYENRKQKLEELKKGLMQQLLTGKIRTV